jgi:Niemann-Pick C1 protein
VLKPFSSRNQNIFCFLFYKTFITKLFQVLAVGVDNIFIIVETFQKFEKYNDETGPEHMGRVLGECAPSMFASTASQTTAFFLGALSDMPAVRAFALYAAASLLINFLMQITAFISLLALNDAREKSPRYDVLCCVKAGKAENLVPSKGRGKQCIKHKP